MADQKEEVAGCREDGSEECSAGTFTADAVMTSLWSPSSPSSSSSITIIIWCYIWNFVKWSELVKIGRVATNLSSPWLVPTVQLLFKLMRLAQNFPLGWCHQWVLNTYINMYHTDMRNAHIAFEWSEEVIILLQPAILETTVLIFYTPYT